MIEEARGTIIFVCTPVNLNILIDKKSDSLIVTSVNKLTEVKTFLLKNLPSGKKTDMYDMFDNKKMWEK